jgi:hypothetical protein
MYTLDGHNLKSEYGITVVRIAGMFDFLARKGETSQDWPDSDGEQAYTDASDIYFKGREIMMTCVIAATSASTLMTNLNAFKTMLQAAGTRALVHTETSTTVNVYMVDSAAVDLMNKWNSTKTALRFMLKLREPSPTRPI